MTSPYLDRPLIPLTIALPQLLENIEAALVDGMLQDAERERLRWRAELIRWLLASRPVT